jgi:lipopolysaccharide biosynthesis glycosyltransferase
MVDHSLPEFTEPSRIRVLFCCDAGYYQHLAVAMVSLLGSNASHQLEIHVISTRREAQSEVKLLRSLESFSNFTLQIHDFRGPQIERWHTSYHITSETYARLFAATILPSSVERILYLDADLVVLADLRELWSFELGDAAVAAVSDPFGASRSEALGLPREAVYINAGVLLMNLGKWRREALAERLGRYIQEQGSRLEYHDQDAINAVLCGQILVLDYRWNFQAKMLRLPRSGVPDRAKIGEASRAPAILHYTTMRKPWVFVMPTPAKAVYRRLLKRTAWRGTPPVGRSWAKLPEYLVNHGLYFLGLDYTWDRVLRRTTIGRVMVRSAKLLRAWPAVASVRRSRIRNSRVQIDGSGFHQTRIGATCEGSSIGSGHVAMPLASADLPAPRPSSRRECPTIEWGETRP